MGSLAADALFTLVTDFHFGEVRPNIRSAVQVGVTLGTFHGANLIFSECLSDRNWLITSVGLALNEGPVYGLLFHMEIYPFTVKNTKRPALCSAGPLGLLSRKVSD